MDKNLTLWDRFIWLFGVKTTFEWCVVGCQIGRHSWHVSYEKCRFGVPIRAGGFLTVYGFGDSPSSEASATAWHKTCLAIAARHNIAHGYAP